MCGISGIVRLGSPESADELTHRLALATSRLAHRGPDDSGLWSDERSEIFLGHRRLSVVDLSSTGHQPMASSSRRWHISYNGEIYNTDRLLSDLGKTRRELRGSSDTEVVVEALDRWGFEAALRRFDGMFALAAWDAFERRLWLARDRFGEKPLYYAHRDGNFVFASEIQAVRIALGVDLRIDRSSLSQLFQYGYIPAPHSIYEGVHKLRAGHGVVVHVDDHRVEDFHHWSPIDAASRSRSHQHSADDAVDQLDDILLQTVSSRLQSDVPLGAFLSGGIDSSLIVAMMSKTNRGSVRSFTIGFNESEYDESRYARQVANLLGTDHSEVVVSAADALAVVPKLAHIYDEPFADSSQLPTWLVCNEARRHATVALSGDGGDELFGGYDRYRVHRRLLRHSGMIPYPIRHLASLALGAPSPDTWNRLANFKEGRFLPPIARRRPAEKALKFSKMLGARRSDLYQLLHTANTERLVTGIASAEDRPDLYRTGRIDGGLESSEDAMLLDTEWYLPEDLLTKVDRASMSVGLEVRAPFLSPEVFDFAWSLPAGRRVGSSSGKVVLRDLLRRYLPDELIDRPKMGFGVPIGRWLRSDLRSWADELLAPERLHTEGLVDVEAVGSMWSQHRSGKLDLSPQIWPILVFQSWYETWR